IQILLSRARFQYDLRDGTVTIEVASRDPAMASDMANFYVRELDRRNQELKSQKAAHDKEFVAERLEDARLRLEKLEDSLRIFQEQTGVLNVEEQVKATITTAAALEALRLATELELGQARQMMQPDNPLVEELERKLVGVRTQMRRLVDREQKSVEDKLLLTLKDAPSYGATYLKLLRDITVQELLYQFLVQQYEQARITEVRHTPTMQAIDWATAPTKRSWPKRGIMILVAGAASFVFAAAIALAMDGFRTASAQPEHPQHARVLALKRLFGREESRKKPLDG
ncbi:MAG: GNVR domain-containing protein, partial [bacterium]